MRVFLFLAIAISLFSCSNESELNYCPSEKACILDAENKIQLIEYGAPEYNILNTGICQTGVVTCLDNSSECSGYIGPTL